MVKVLINKYPMGSLPGQRTPGRYFDENLKSNIDIIVETIVDDLQFLGLCSCSTYEVRSGKSTFMQQIGEYYTETMNEKHGLNLTFSMNNIVFNSADMIKRAFELPPYSCLILDENDEIDEHYYSKLSKDLRRFFRKSGQLNLFIILIVPNFFQLKSNYAISRSNFLIDVRFHGKFERGYFSFYNFERKRELYIHGKKTQNYYVVKPNFVGRFLKGYAVNERGYKEAKRKDLMKWDDEEKIPDEREISIRLFKQLREKLPGITIKKLAEAFSITERTGSNWLKSKNNNLEGTDEAEKGMLNEYNNSIKNDKDKSDDETG